MDLGFDDVFVDLDQGPAGRRIAIENVAGTAVVHDRPPADLADLGQVCVAANDHPGVGSADAVHGNDRIEVRPQAVRERARRSVAEEDQVIADAQAALRREASQIVDAVVADLVARPFGGSLIRVRDAFREPWEGGRVVAVGDGEVRVAEGDERAGPLELLHEGEAARGIRAVEDQVAANGHEVRARGMHGLADGLQGRQVAVNVGQSRNPHHQRRALSGAMMKLSLASQATSPSTVATPWPRPNLLPRRSIVTSRRSWSPGVTMRLKRHSSMAAKRPSRSPKPGCWATKMPIVWARASIWSTPGMIGWPGKCPWKNHSVAVPDLRPTIRFASASYSTIRSTSRNGQRCGISFSIWRVVRMVLLVVLVAAVSVTGGSWVRLRG